jgi:quercetin dioxygenase-like cupin family protein
MVGQYLKQDVSPNTKGTIAGVNMSANGKQASNAIALSKDEVEAIWFLGLLATIKASGEATGGRVAVIDHLAPRGAGSPLHVHHNEDELFYVTEGELTSWVGGKVTSAAAGSFVYGPRDIPHTFTVTSPQARFLVVVEPAGFEKFMRTLSVPATTPTIPPATVLLPSMEHVMTIAAQYGIEIIGPPGIPS